MHRAISALPQYVFMTWFLVKHRDNFTVTLHPVFTVRIQLFLEDHLSGTQAAE
jgi:hypothetical protein